MKKYAPQSDFNWADNWCSADDGVQDVASPGESDIAVFTANSGDCICDDYPVVLAVDMTGYEGTYSGYGFETTAGPTILSGTFDLEEEGDLFIGGGVTLMPGTNWVHTPGQLIGLSDGSGNFGAVAMILEGNGCTIPFVQMWNAGSRVANVSVDIMNVNDAVEFGDNVVCPILDVRNHSSGAENAFITLDRRHEGCILNDVAIPRRYIAGQVLVVGGSPVPIGRLKCGTDLSWTTS